ncbi:MAG TPA: NAD(P)H-binding protein, partial [Blastocatellia bacterium]|nr:NAD(P)H-binding protein [Blastocatellia bacterium]
PPSNRNILVTGATGFTGRQVVPLLVERYRTVACLVRRSSNCAAIDLPGVTLLEGDLEDRASLERALQGKDTLVSIAYLVGRTEHGPRLAKNIVGACRVAGVKRAVFVSSASIFTTLSAPAKEAKLAAEDVVINSGLDYTILRPTMIYGGPGDRNMIRLIRFLQRYPVVFVPGDGEGLQQPVHVEDLAKAIADCLEVEATFGKAYNLSGACPITFNEIVDQSCLALGVKRIKVHLPLGLALLAARLLNMTRRRGWIKEEQLLRLNEDKSIDHSEARRDFGFSPRSFLEGISREVAHASLQSLPAVDIRRTAS